MVQYWKQLQLTPRFILSHKLSIPSSNTLSNANAPITIVTANVEVRRNKALYTVLPILILALESSRNPSLYFHRLLGARWRLRVFILQRTMVKFQVAKCDGIFTSSSRQVYYFSLQAGISTPHFHFFENFLAIRDRMSTMLSNVSLDHDEGMDVQEASTFRFSEEPSLEKM